MHSCLLLFHQINKKMFYNKLSYNMLTLFSSRDSGDLKRASGDPALAKMLIKYYLSYLFSILSQMWSLNIYLLNYMSVYFY